MKTKKKRTLPFGKITEIFLLLIMAVYPLVIGTGGYQSISASKYTAFCVLCGGYVLAMALLAVEAALVGELKWRSPAELVKSSNWAQRFALIYLFFTWVSALASEYLPQTVTGGSRHENALTITLYVLTFLLVSVFGKLTRLHLWGLGVSVTLFCAVCFLQFAGLNPFSLYPEGMNYYDAGVKYSGEYLGTIGNVDLVAAYLCIVIPIFWVSLLRLSGKRRFFLALPLACAVVVLFQMNVSAGLLGVCGGAVLSLPAVCPVSKKMRMRMAIAIGCAAVGALIAVYFVDLGGFLHELHEVLHGNLDESFGSGRIHIWKEVCGEIPSHIWLGAGPDTMLEADLQSFSRFDENLNAYIVGSIDAAHNELLNILFSQGIFALLAFLAMIFSAARTWLHRSPDSPAVAATGAACLCYFIQAMFGISQCTTAVFFWVCLGLTALGESGQQNLALKQR